MANRARRIFEERFALEKLLRNVIALHEERMEPVQPEAGLPLVSVVVRCGGRPPEILRRAISSLAAQTHRPIELVLVVYTDFDPAGALADSEAAFPAVQVRRVPGGDRSTTLWTGLRASTGDYIAYLDDDDEWMPEHLSELLRCARAHPDSRLVYSGLIRDYLEPFVTGQGNAETRQVLKMPVEGPSQDLLEQMGQIPPAGLLIDRSLLDPWLLRDPGLATGEDSFLLGSLLSKTRAVFDYRATVIAHESADGSNWRDHELRHEHEAALRLRLFGRRAATGGNAVRRQDVLASLGAGSLRAVVRANSGVAEYLLPASFGVLADPEKHLEGQTFALSPDRVTLRGASRIAGDEVFPVEVAPPPGPWEYGALLRVPVFQDCQQVLRVSGEVTAGSGAVGVLRVDGGFSFRRILPVGTGRFTVDLPVTAPEVFDSIVVQAAERPDDVSVRIDRIEIFADNDDGPSSVAGGTT
jgi:glycosyltransferase involved in cell wall biosynthesis